MDLIIPSLGASNVFTPSQGTNLLPITMMNTARHSRFSVVSINITDAGVYNEQYIRAFETHVDQNVFESFQRLMDNCSSSNNIPSSIIGQSAWQFMTLSATPYQRVKIPHGWNSKRFRFTLVVEEANSLSMRSKIRHIFQGFTENADISLQNTFNPDMQFYINSFMTVSRTEVAGPMGSIITDRMIDSGQMLDPSMLYSSINTSIAMMRPGDLMATVQDSNLANLVKSTTGTMGEIFDGRNTFTSAASFNSRSNNMVSNYLSGTINAMRTASRFDDFGQDTSGRYDKAGGALYNRSFVENDFLIALGALAGMHAHTCRFTLNNLKELDRSFNRPIYDKLVGAAASGLQNSMNSESWSAPDGVTKSAATIANEIPSLASSLLLHSLAFVVTNSTAGGDTDWRITQMNSTSSNAIDLTQMVLLFKDRFIAEVMTTLTYNNQLTYWLEVNYNVFDNIRIRLSLDGSPITDYYKPVFCDSLSAPILAPDKNHVNKVAYDMERLFNAIDFQGNTADTSLGSLDIPKSLY